MTSLLFFWLAIGIGFLVIEMITVTFYGLAISIAAFAVSAFVWLTGAAEIGIVQGIIFAVASFVASFFLPLYLSSQVVEQAQGLDIYFGEKRKVKKVGEDFKVILDGVEYMVDIDDVQAGDRVELTSRKGSLFHGKIIG